MEQLLHISYESALANDGILRSQVFPLVKRLSKRGVSCTVVSGELLGRGRLRSEKTRLREDLKQWGIRLVCIPKLNIPPIDIAAYWAVCLFLTITRKITVVHGRSYLPSMVGVLLKRICGLRVIFDPRGVLPEELAYLHKYFVRDGNTAFRALKAAERYILAHADAVICVSANMVRHYKGIHPESNCLVAPSCVDDRFMEAASSARVQAREELRLEGKCVLAYCGSLLQYQMLDRILALFEALSRFIPNLHLFFITPDRDVLEKAIARMGVEPGRITIASAPHDRVHRLLQCADIGVLLREDNLINQVASPLKLGEYLASGLPVITTKGIGDANRIFAQYDCGWQLGMDGDFTVVAENIADCVNTDLPRLRRNACRAAREEFRWEPYMDRLLCTYGGS